MALLPSCGDAPGRLEVGQTILSNLCLRNEITILGRRSERQSDFELILVTNTSLVLCEVSLFCCPPDPL